MGRAYAAAPVRSTRSADADAPARARDRALRAARRRRVADRLSEGDEQVVELDPVPPRQAASERGLRLLGIARADEAQAVRDPVHVRVDADPGQAEPEGDDQVRRLPPDAVE